MRAHEFIVETAEESKLINIIAEQLMYNLIEQTKVKQQGFNKTIYNLLANDDNAPTKEIFEKKINQIMSWGNNVVNDKNQDKIYYLLSFLLKINITIEKLKPNIGGYWNRNQNKIALNSNKIGDWGQVYSILAHEMIHATDSFKSSDEYIEWYSNKTHKSSHSYDPNQTHDEYLRNPHEINARFQQALLRFSEVAFDLALKADEQKLKNLYKNIKRFLNVNQITRDMFPEGTKGNQKYNHLYTRFIKFWEVIKPDVERVLEDAKKNVKTPSFTNYIKQAYQKAIGYAKSFTASLF